MTITRAALTIGCHRRLRGPYTGGGALLRVVAPALMAVSSESVGRQSNAIVSAAPDLEGQVPPASQTLTNQASLEERTRFYSAQRTREIAHGIAALVLDWARLCQPDGVALLFTDVDAADPTDRELIEVLGLRCDPALVTIATSSATTSPVPTATPADIGPGDDLALAERFVGSDGTSADPREQAAYQALGTRARQELHSRRAAELVAAGLPGAAWGAIPYHLENGLEATSGGVDALLAALYSCFDAGFYHACIDFAERGLALLDGGERWPEQVRLTQRLIGALTYVDRGEDAMSYVQGLRRRSTDATEHMRCNYTMAMLYTRHLPVPQRDEDEALACANTAIALADGHQDPSRRAFYGAFMRNGRALVELHRGDLPGALALVEEAISLTDALQDEEHRLHRTVLIHNRGRVLMGLGRVESALADLDEVVARDDEYDEAYFDRAGAHRVSGNLEAALADYDQAIRLSVNFAEAYYNRADTLLELGDAAAALADLDTVLTLVPDHADALLNRAGIHLDDGRLAAAEADIERGLELAPEDPHLWSARGRLRVEQDRAEAARQDFDRALEIDPELVDALGNRAVVLFAAGRLDECLADLDRAVVLSGSAALLLNRGVARQARGLHESALEDFDAALAAEDADVPELLRLRDLSLRETGRLAVAGGLAS
jgi:tetratricopeptide (TPR) repeat protein